MCGNERASGHLVCATSGEVCSSGEGRKRIHHLVQTSSAEKDEGREESFERNKQKEKKYIAIKDTHRNQKISPKPPAYTPSMTWTPKEGRIQIPMRMSGAETDDPETAQRPPPQCNIKRDAHDTNSGFGLELGARARVNTSEPAGKLAF